VRACVRAAERGVSSADYFSVINRVRDEIQRPLDDPREGRGRNEASRDSPIENTNLRSITITLRGPLASIPRALTDPGAPIRAL